MPRICVVPGCKTGSRIELSKHSLFCVLKDTVRWKQWENAIPGISKLSSLDVICDKHFKAEDIFHEWKKEDENGQLIARVQYKRPRLSDTAVPTKFNESTGKMGVESADLENLSPNIVNDIVNLLPATTSDMKEANMELPLTAEPSSDYDEPLPFCQSKNETKRCSRKSEAEKRLRCKKNCQN